MGSDLASMHCGSAGFCPFVRRTVRLTVLEWVPTYGAIAFSM
jgi:hypothetical protein